MVPRLKRLLAEEPEPIELAVLLGGTNDLVRYPADRIIHTLGELHAIAAQHAQTVAVTLPEVLQDAYPLLTTRRGDVNREIRSGRIAPKVIDLDNATCRACLDAPGDRGQLWDDDAIHLTAAGYDLLGEFVGQLVVAHFRNGSHTLH